MNKSITQKLKNNLLILSIIVTLIFLIINISLYLINNNYLVNKVKEENLAFLQITTHILNENEVEIGLEYVEHYTHIHQVNIEVVDSNDNMIFSSNVAHQYTSQYRIYTEKGTFTVFIDNTDSITVSKIETNTVYVNISLLFIYILAMVVLIKMNKKSSSQINKDIERVLSIMSKSTVENNNFNFIEFRQITNNIILYLENIDLLTEQKEMNMKGLAHDIKTPLTIIYSYFEKVLREENITNDIVEIAFQSSKRINDLVNDIIENNKRNEKQIIDVSEIILDKVSTYKTIFENKNIKITHNINKGVFVESNKKDLSRVIDNLISNAYYYSKHGSIFDISIEENNDVNIHFVSSPLSDIRTDVASIFRKGYRGETSDKLNQYGKGLGLYISKIMLKNLGNDISVTIEDENVKFTICL